MFNLSSLFDSLVGLFVLATISVIILLIIISILYIILFVVDLFDHKNKPNVKAKNGKNLKLFGKLKQKSI